MDTGELLESECRYQQADGTCRWHLRRALPAEDGSGGAVTCAGAAPDIDEARRAAAARDGLYEAERAARAAAQDALRVRDELLASVSHDLKIPLTAIKAFAQVAQRRAARIPGAEAAQMAEPLASINTLTEKMEAMIGDLLDISRLQTGRSLDLQLQPTDLVELVRRCAAEHQRSTDRHTIGVQSTLSELVGLYDHERLERVVSNLLTNALHYSDGGEITVTLARDGDDGGAARWAVLSVRDQGIGIPPADLPRIFERFYRGANVAGRPGSGIGLTGTRQIVEQHGGTIAVASTEGAGSVFTVRLPL